MIGSGLDAAAGEPHGEAVRIVIAAVAALRHGEAAEFGAPDDEGGIEQAALLEVGEKAGDREVGHAAHFLVVADEVFVRVPLHGDGSAAGVELDEADAAFDEAAGEQAAGAEFVGALLVDAVELAGGGGFLGEIDGFGGGTLHAEGELVGADAGGHFAVAIEGVHLVHLLQEVEGVALARGGHAFGGLQVDDGFGAGAEDGALVDGGKESGAPARCAAFGGAFGLRHDDVGGEVLALAAESVGDPRAHARVAHEDAAGVDLVHGGRVDGAVGIEAADEAEVVHALGDVGEEGGDFASALAVFAEVPGAAEERGIALGELADDGAVAGW